MEDEDMSEGYFHRLQQETPTRLWINNPTLAEADLAIAAGAISCTTNPAYSARIIKMEPERAARAIQAAIKESSDDQRAADIAQQRIVKEILEKFLPLYNRAPGLQGLVSIQGNPHLDEDPAHIVDEAFRFRKIAPNFITKIPCTAAGLKAFEQLIPGNMPIIATEVFALAQASEVCELYQRVSKKCGKHPPFYVTHISGIFDECLAKTAEREGIKVSPEALAQAGCILARRQYAMMKQRGYNITLMGGGARGTHHFTEMVGGALHVTINWSTADEIIKANPPITSRIDAVPSEAIVDELCDKLPDFRAAYRDDGLTIEEFGHFAPLQFFRNMFVKGWDTLADAVREQRSKVLATTA
jgi:transaldolase